MTAVALHSYAPRRIAKGTVSKSGGLSVACRFDEATFDTINRLACASNIPFAAQVRRLVDAGLKLRAVPRA